MSDQVMMFLISQAVGAAAIYAAIRADLREHGTRITHIEHELDFIRGKA